MKHTLKTISDTRVSISVTVDKAELLKAKNVALAHLAKQVKIPGFRKGKVPSAVAEKNLDPLSLANEVVEHAVNDTLNQIIDSENLRVLDKPNVDLGKFEPFEILEYTAEIEVLPKVKLGDYKKLKAKKENITVEKSEIDEVLDRMRQNFAEKNEVKRAAKTGDETLIDFDGYDKDGSPVEGAKGSDYPLNLGSGSFIPGFEEQIIGHKAGEQFDIEVTFPADYHAEQLKNAKVTFKINLKKVQEVVLPPIDDAFAKKSGPFDSAKALKDDVKRELTAQKERTALNKYKDDLLGDLVSKSTIPLSQVLIDDQMRSIEQDAMQNLMYRGMSPEQYMNSQGYKDHDDWREKEFRKAAEQRVQAGLALAELSKLEKIEISKDELEAELERRKAEAPNMAAQFDTPEARRDLANRVITEKTIDRLVDLSSKK